MRRLLYDSISVLRADKLFWTLGRSRLRIICYHGVCPDALATEPWMPHFFVTESSFRRQLEYLSRSAVLLPLPEAAAHLRNGTLPARSACITFDDGYANNLRNAYPILQSYGVAASIFLSTSFIETGDFFPFLKLKLIRATMGAIPPFEYKTNPIDRSLQWADHYWAEASSRLSDVQRETLRPMTPAEVGAFDPELIDIGGHTHTHCILGNETEARRTVEITGCLQRISEWTGRPVRTFSYPNGQRGEFGEVDKRVLREHRIEAAVAGIAGANPTGADLLELRRYPVGLFHDSDSTFSAEVTGLRTAVRSVAAGFQI